MASEAIIAPFTPPELIFNPSGPTVKPLGLVPVPVLSSAKETVPAE